MTTLNMALTGARFRDLTEIELIGELRVLRGIIAGDVNEGQIELARWMLADVRPGHFDQFVPRLISMLSEKQALRILTGEIEPSGEVASQIAEATEGRVALAMWRRSVAASESEQEIPAPPPTPLVLQSGERLIDVLPVRRPARHLQLGDHLDLINTSTGVTIVAAGRMVTIPASALAALHGGIGQMLAQ